MRKDEFKIEGQGNLALRVLRWVPDNVRAAMHIIHGLSDHADRYAELAEMLARHGIAAYAHDQRGHGRSVDVNHPLGHFDDDDGWSKIIEDAILVGNTIRERHPDTPFVRFGHSMGGYVTQHLLFTDPGQVDAAILSGSNGKQPPIATAGRLIARVERARHGKRSASPLLQKLSFGDFNKRFEPTRTAFDWITRDPSRVDAYINDPLAGQDPTTQTWIDLLDALPEITSASNQRRIRKTLPIYMFSGEQDPVGDFGKGTERLYRAYQVAGLSDVTLKLYPDARHELLNETNRDEIMTDLKNWLRNQNYIA